GGVDIDVDDGPRLELRGRRSVFDGMPWSAYVPAGRGGRLTGRPLPGMQAVVAVAQAPLSGRPGVSTERILVAPHDLEIVRHGDLVIVDQGYHPFAATQGYDAYYLNALAGDRRTMANTDDPDIAWVRTLWPAMEQDPRLPLVRP